MADDWKPGDGALCIAQDSEGLLTIGRVYTVRELNLEWLWLGGLLGLVLVELAAHDDPRDGGFDARRFIKLSGHTPDAEDAETIRLLRGAPVREPAEAARDAIDAQLAKLRPAGEVG